MNRLLFLVLIMLCLVNQGIQAQSCPGGKGNMPTKCLEITSVLVDACSSPEGANEMVRLKVGPNSLTISSLTVSWPNNPFKGFCPVNSTTQGKINSINATITGCGKLVVPSGGTIPAGAEVLIITSEDFDAGAHSFATLQDTLYVLLQCAGNTNGHFANYGSGGGTRTTTINYGSCSEVATYDRDLLIKQNGSRGAQDGAMAIFDYSGTVTYANNGCQVPVLPYSLDAGTGGTVCGTSFTVSNATASSNIFCLNWTASNPAAGTFNDSTMLKPTFTATPGFSGQVVLHLKGKGSCTSLEDSITLTFPVINKPSAGADQQYCTGDSAHLSGSTAPQKRWYSLSGGQFGDSTQSSTWFKPVNSTDTGLFTLVYEITETCGKSTDTLIIHFGSLNAAFSGLDTLYCTGSPADTALPLKTGGIFTGLNAGNEFIPATPGTYHVKYVLSEQGCIDSASLTIKVVSPPDATFTGLDTAYCLGAPSASLLATTPGGTFNCILVTGSSFSPTTVGDYQVKYIIVQNGCSDSTILPTRVNGLPDATFTGVNPGYCIGDPVIQFLPSKTGGYFHIGGQQVTSFTPTTAGLYTVTYVVNDRGCTDSTSRTFTVQDKPNAGFTGLSSDYCEGDPEVTLNPAVSGGTFSTPADMFGRFNPNTAGTYTIIYKVSNGACADSTSRQTTVHPRPVAQFTATPNPVEQQQQVKFTFTGTGANSFNWDFADGHTSTDRDPSYTYNSSGEYLVNLVVRNTWGCEDSTSLSVTVIADQEDIYISNAFTPNGDSINDVFAPVTKGIRNYWFEIYNRWGERLFITNNTAETWNGTYSGKDAPDGVYVFKVKAVGFSGKEYLKTGTVTLMR